MLNIDLYNYVGVDHTLPIKTAPVSWPKQLTKNKRSKQKIFVIVKFESLTTNGYRKPLAFFRIQIKKTKLCFVQEIYANFMGSLWLTLADIYCNGHWTD